jgi:hypothetical protein
MSDDAPDPVLQKEPGLFNSGPQNSRGRFTVVTLDLPARILDDKAAYIHDANYADTYQRYQYSEFEYGLSFASSVGLGMLLDERTVGVCFSGTQKLRPKSSKRSKIVLTTTRYGKKISSVG